MAPEPLAATGPAPLTPAAFVGVAGVARRDITPPATIYARNWGAAQHDAADGIHRPLTLTAVAFAENVAAAPLVLIAADLGWWREPGLERSVREPLLAALQLPPARLIFNLSHTHSGPALSAAFAALPGGEHIAPYLTHLRAAALEAAREAVSRLAPARLEWCTGRCDLAANRDLADPAAPADRPRTVCGFNPALEADDTVLVGRLTAAADGRVLATVVNYACHPVTLAWQNRKISPDYVGALRETVEAATQAPCLFLQGASGELGPAEQYTGDLAVADRHGRRLGHAALSALAALPAPGHELAYTGVVESGAPLAVWQPRPRAFTAAAPAAGLAADLGQTEFAIKADYPPLAEIERQYAAASAAGDRVMAERLRRKCAVRENLGDGAALAFPHVAWRLGEALVLGVPHEAYSALQTELRRRFAPRPVVVMNLANGSTGYLPPAALYSRDLYQVWVTPFAAGTLERLIASAAASLERLLSPATSTPAKTVTSPGA